MTSAARGGMPGLGLFSRTMAASPPDPEVRTALQEQQGMPYLDYVEQRILNLAHAHRARERKPPIVAWAVLPVLGLVLALAAVGLVFV
jgi:hypothetical protein